MPTTVVVGGQFGSEGKGKVCAHLALRGDADIMVRCGGPNSGHTVQTKQQTHRLRQIPSGFINPDTMLMIAPGALLDPRIFLREVQEYGLGPERIHIDPNTAVIEESDLEAELELSLQSRLGSTLTGTGHAVSRRIMRDPSFRSAQDHPGLQPYVRPVRQELQQALQLGKSIVIEGTQGFGLSLYHADTWPFRTSRDTTAHSFLGEAGIGDRNPRVIMALRTHPIRVAGNSGPMPRETTWEQVRLESGYPREIIEMTTATNRTRRVARFDPGVVEAAVQANAPQEIFLHGADYLDARNLGATRWEDLTENAREFIQDLEELAGVPVTLVGTGPDQDEIIDRGPGPSPPGQAIQTAA